MRSPEIPSDMDAPATDTPALCITSSPGCHTSTQKTPPPHKNTHTFCAVNVVQRWHNVTSAVLTQKIHTVCANVGESLELKPEHISTWSLQSSGAMALLIGNIDANNIQLIGRWCSG